MHQSLPPIHREAHPAQVLSSYRPSRRAQGFSSVTDASNAAKVAENSDRDAGEADVDTHSGLQTPLGRGTVAPCLK